MEFKSFSKKYDFSKGTLIRNFPQYLQLPIVNWLYTILQHARVIDEDYRRRDYFRKDFRDELNINFREVFPNLWLEAVPFIFSDTNRTLDFIAMCLQNFANSRQANDLEEILSLGGSAFEVVPTKKNPYEYDEGVYNLSERVKPVVKIVASTALSENELLQQAWDLCYSRDPDYSKVVINCQDFLEHFLRDKYEPSNSRPQIGKLIGNLKKSPQKLNYKGETVLVDKTLLLSLIDNIAQFRGLHTAGTGKVPKKDEAEFILHTTIFIWNLHQK